MKESEGNMEIRIEYPITFQSTYPASVIETKFTKPTGQMDIAAMLAHAGNRFIEHVDATLGKGVSVITISHSHDTLYVGSTMYVTFVSVFTVVKEEEPPQES